MQTDQNLFVRSKERGMTRMTAGCWMAAIITVAVTVEAAGQATVTFQNAGTGYLWPIYLPETEDAYRDKHGNTATGLPPGTQTYGGGLVSGTDHTAQLWAGPAGASEEQLTPVASTTFRTGAQAGRLVAVTVPLPGVLPGTPFVWQARAWDNRTNTITSWAQVLANPSVARGKTILVAAISTIPPAQPPATTSGGESFNLHLDWAPYVPWSTIDGGGGASSGGGFTISGTIGQPDAGAMSGGGFTLAGGFWGLYDLSQSPPRPLLLIRRAGANAVLSWPVSVTGFTLEYTTQLGSGVWTMEPSFVVDSGTEHTVTVPANSSRRFYRLKK